MPESEREIVFARAFEKGSGRIGHKKGVEMDKKIDLATRAHVKHQYTDFESMKEDATQDLYDELLEGKEFMCREIRNYAHEEFKVRKSQLYEDFGIQVQAEIQSKINEWK